MTPMTRRALLLVAVGLLCSALGQNAAGEADSNNAETDHDALDIQEAKAEFDSIDTNGDGFIGREARTRHTRRPPSAAVSADASCVKLQEILEMEDVPEQEEVTEFFETCACSEPCRALVLPSRFPHPPARQQLRHQRGRQGLFRRDHGDRRAPSKGGGGGPARRLVSVWRGVCVCVCVCTCAGVEARAHERGLSAH